MYWCGDWVQRPQSAHHSCEGIPRPPRQPRLSRQSTSCHRQSAKYRQQCCDPEHVAGSDTNDYKSIMCALDKADSDRLLFTAHGRASSSPGSPPLLITVEVNAQHQHVPSQDTRARGNPASAAKSYVANRWAEEFYGIQTLPFQKVPRRSTRRPMKS